MSTNNECAFIEIEPNKWYYILEETCAPKNAWDWMDNADAYGPFASEDIAHRHLRDNHANPGGSSSQPYNEGYEPNDTIKALIEAAKGRKRSREIGPRWSW